MVFFNPAAGNIGNEVAVGIDVLNDPCDRRLLIAQSGPHDLLFDHRIRWVAQQIACSAPKQVGRRRNIDVQRRKVRGLGTEVDLKELVCPDLRTDHVEDAVVGADEPVPFLEHQQWTDFFAMSLIHSDQMNASFRIMTE